MSGPDTISGLLERGAPDAVAISSTEGGAPLRYRDLRGLVRQVGAELAGQAIRPHDRVAIVLENGPEAATAFLSVASAATAAPLNPGYRDEEFEFYLTDLRAKLLMVERDKPSPVRAVAERLGVPIVELVPEPERGTGAFALATAAPAALAALAAAAPAAPALVLHTSGTTSRPKIVPLSHRNLVASAANVRASLDLGDTDRGLGIMPLFHIHGLVAGLLAPLSAGGEVCCSRGFNALKFFSWLAAVRPTWYTGVPTMHQAILARAPRNADAIAASRLRFIRSSSASLPATVLTELERVFGVPVIEAYGMTEAAHQMASNPLPPRARKPGTVGLAAGPAIRVVGEDGREVAVGATGEIVIRGGNVMGGYEARAEVNAAAFVDGWFRTGDQGTLDQDGYLTITGRLKEIINRGGEKISPREVDEILLEHPAVHQCVTFAIPHRMLGEEVAAAVVLREGHAAESEELRAFAARRLADFKVPRRIVILTAIPMGATGKLQRIGLAAKLGLA
jgi:acyl-CoA synthetase (AMP-forming)/AMP-acid ligase II